MESIDRSLMNLGLKYVDVILSHRPDYLTPIKEVCQGFNDIIN